jgi:hypothetical protein
VATLFGCACRYTPRLIGGHALLTRQTLPEPTGSIVAFCLNLFRKTRHTARLSLCIVPHVPAKLWAWYRLKWVFFI